MNEVIKATKASIAVMEKALKVETCPDTKAFFIEAIAKRKADLKGWEA